MSTEIDIDAIVPVIEPSEYDDFIAYNDDWHVSVIGATEDEARDRFRDGVRHLIAYCKARNLPLPVQEDSHVGN